MTWPPAAEREACDPRLRQPGLRWLALLWLALLWLALLWLASACAVRPPAPVTVLDEQVPAAWQASREPESALAIDDAGGDTAPALWWSAFGDPLLDSLIREAQAKSYDLAAVAADLDAAWAQARIAGAERLPQLSAGMDASRRQQVFVGLPIPGTAGVLPSRSTSVGISLNIGWEADLWGRLKAGQAAARADATTAAFDFDAARLSISAQTAKAYFALREASRQRELARATLSSRQQTVARTTARYRRGIAPPLDVRLARLEQAQATAELARRTRVEAGTRRALELLVGRYPAGHIAAGEGPLPPPPAAPPAGLPAELVRRRPDLAAAEQRLLAAGWQLAEARAALYPRLSLTGSAGTTSDQLRDLVDRDFSVWNLAGNILGPIFQGGRLRAAVELREASRERALAAYASAVLSAFAEVETALDDAARLAAEEAALADAGNEARRAAKLARARYNAGLGDADAFLQVLEADRRSLAADSQLAAIRGARLSNRIDLYVALGGGLPAGRPAATSKEPAS